MKKYVYKIYIQDSEGSLFYNIFGSFGTNSDIDAQYTTNKDCMQEISKIKKSAAFKKFVNKYFKNGYELGVTRSYEDIY